MQRLNSVRIHKRDDGWEIFAGVHLEESERIGNVPFVKFEVSYQYYGWQLYYTRIESLDIAVALLDEIRNDKEVMKGMKVIDEFRIRKPQAVHVVFPGSEG